jgi:hypothetical protein
VQIKTQIASILKSEGSKSLLQKALEIESHEGNLVSLHLRNLDINDSTLHSITEILKLEVKCLEIKSVSLSYNNNLTEKGLIPFIENLPKSIREIGLVGCDMNDLIGKKIIEKINCLPNLSMICIEKNNFSKNIINELRNYKLNNPQVLTTF